MTIHPSVEVRVRIQEMEGCIRVLKKVLAVADPDRPERINLLSRELVKTEATLKKLKA